jgi:hypothetical protein
MKAVEVRTKPLGVENVQHELASVPHGDLTHDRCRRDAFQGRFVSRWRLSGIPSVSLVGRRELHELILGRGGDRSIAKAESRLN